LFSEIEALQFRLNFYATEFCTDDYSAIAATVDDVHVYPSSAHHTRDWDKVVSNIKKEEETEKPEGDAALNQLFEKIYGDGSDEVKKAMAKSFVST
jgi:hypothetical protein